MNEPYFACTNCRVYIDAGYRWAYSELERPRHAELGSEIDVDRLLEATAYWDPPEGAESLWLRQLLPEIRAFLLEHRSHSVLYAEGEDFLDTEDPEQFDWLHIAGYVQQPTPRYFAEVLQLQNWHDVKAWVASNREPWWWQLFPEQYAWAREKFETLIGGKGNRGEK